jgi:enoyl-CoA hydratase/carnithine racemase
MSFARLELSSQLSAGIESGVRPAIAVLSGAVAPLEYERALECSLIVIGADATLTLPGGEPPQCASTLRNLCLRVGEGGAWRFWLGEGTCDARQALASRLVDELDDEPGVRAAGVLKLWEIFPDATRGLAELLRAQAALDEASGLRLESARFALLFCQADTRSAIRRFLDRSR